ncbi:MAG TPA: alpha/beta hydrolase, partial [Bacteroidales bacterium]|nr:alpha/beta hydrolase [Bacteroidales bacterium]
MKPYKKHSESSSDVILLHGGPGAVGEMNDLAISLLERELPVIEHYQNGYTISSLIRELKTLVEQQIPDQKAILAGHSWGAWLAWIFAAHYPELTKGLILIASGSFHPDFNIDLTGRRIAKLPPKLKNEAIVLLQ